MLNDSWYLDFPEMAVKINVINFSNFSNIFYSARFIPPTLYKKIDR